MACNELGSKLTDYEMGELSPTERSEVEAHLASCLDCQAELNLLQVTATAVMQACAADGASAPTLSSERRDQIRKVAQAQRSAAAARGVPFWSRLQFRSWSFGLSAAALLLLGLVGVVPIAMFTATGSKVSGLLDAPLAPGDRLVIGGEVARQGGQKEPARTEAPLTETATLGTATDVGTLTGGSAADTTASGPGAPDGRADKPSIGLFAPQSSSESAPKAAPPVITRPTAALRTPSVAAAPAAAPAPVLLRSVNSRAVDDYSSSGDQIKARLMTARSAESSQTAQPEGASRPMKMPQAPRPLSSGPGYRVGSIGAASTPAEARGIGTLTAEPPLRELARSYVDKTTRMTPHEPQKLKSSMANYLPPTAPSGTSPSASGGAGSGGAATGRAGSRRAPSIVTDALAREKAYDAFAAATASPADSLSLGDDEAAGLTGSAEDTLGDGDDGFYEGDTLDGGDVVDEAAGAETMKKDAEEARRQAAVDAAETKRQAAEAAAVAAAKAKELAEQREDSQEAVFAGTGINPFVRSSRDRLSTFAMDVDTASYVMGRSHLMSRDLPPHRSVRVEEWVNAFDYGYAPPLDGVFAIHAQAAPSPYRPNHLLLAVGLQARRVDEAKRRPAVLTFIVDVSGSMNMSGRLDLVRQSLSLLVERLTPNDQVAIVEYDTQSRTILPPTPVSRRDAILIAIQGLRTRGSTNLAAGMKLGYQVADIGFDAECINRVILCSDGVANTGATDAASILESVRRHAERGIFLTTVGVGMRGVNDALLERLANDGNGVYALVDGLDEAKRIFVDGLSGTLETVARDAKIQVEFDPAVVRRWRLLGYENRDIADRDFRNDKVDAGEVGAGHAVTALYELDLTDNLEGSLGTVRVRYKSPQGSRVTEVAEALSTDRIAPSFAKASSAYRLAAVVAQFAEILRRSPYARGRTVEELIPQVAEVLAERGTDQRVVELETLVRNAASIEESKGMPTKR